MLQSEFLTEELHVERMFRVFLNGENDEKKLQIMKVEFFFTNGEHNRALALMRELVERKEKEFEQEEIKQEELLHVLQMYCTKCKEYNHHFNAIYGYQKILEVVLGIKTSSANKSLRDLSLDELTLLYETFYHKYECCLELGLKGKRILEQTHLSYTKV